MRGQDTSRYGDPDQSEQKRMRQIRKGEGNQYVSTCSIINGQ